MASAISTGSRMPWHRGGGSVHRRFPLPAKADMSWRSLKRKYRRSNKRTDAPFLSYLRSDMRKESKKIHPRRRMDFFSACGRTVLSLILSQRGPHSKTWYPLQIICFLMQKRRNSCELRLFCIHFPINLLRTIPGLHRPSRRKPGGPCHWRAWGRR